MCVFVHSMCFKGFWLEFILRGQLVGIGARISYLYYNRKESCEAQTMCSEAEHWHCSSFYICQ